MPASALHNNCVNGACLRAATSTLAAGKASFALRACPLPHAPAQSCEPRRASNACSHSIARVCADTDGDGVPDCKDPCVGGGTGKTASCPVKGPGADASYFTVTPDCKKKTARVVYSRAPQLKTSECKSAEEVSWCGPQPAARCLHAAGYA